MIRVEQDNDKKFLYLVQGQKHLVRNFSHLRKRGHGDAILLTYDEELEGASFFPNSTWAEGRNKLLLEALAKKPYQYYIFCDDDTEFAIGSWDEFERQLIEYKPGIAIPLFPKTRNSPLPFPKLSGQSFFINDEQLIAFHQEVVQDRLVLPYQTKFDHINWWISCEIQQILIQNFYPYDSLQFNNIVVENTCEKRYSSQYDHDVSFRNIAREWLSKEFKGEYRLTSYYVPLRLHRLFYRTFHYFLKRKMNKNLAVRKRTISRLLSSDSVLLKQFERNIGNGF